jgi:hypothetical protein
MPVWAGMKDSVREIAEAIRGSLKPRGYCQECGQNAVDEHGVCIWCKASTAIEPRYGVSMEQLRILGQMKQDIAIEPDMIFSPRGDGDSGGSALQCLRLEYWACLKKAAHLRAVIERLELEERMP